MKAILTCIAFAAMAGTALAQAEQRPTDDPHSVKPIDSQAQTTDADMIRSKIERMGYTDVVDLSRDSMGVCSHCSTSSGVISMTGIAFSWIGSTIALGSVVMIENSVWSPMLGTFLVPISPGPHIRSGHATDLRGPSACPPARCGSHPQ
jgi:hypothetical protein